MDAKVTKKKLGLKDRYAAMTRGLHWDTTYQPMDKVFPYDKYEGIKSSTTGTSGRTRSA
jgi:phenol/toluene 2-monooxygenase (NADH) P3/A3